jgi:Na+/proline symporter
LVEYVPAETITLYLATIAALPAFQSDVRGDAQKMVYWGFAMLTPVLYALIYAGKRNAAGESRWPGFRGWPWWPTFAATAAFMAWAITVPGGPYLTRDSEGGVVAGLLAIFVSTLLGVAGRFFAPTKRKQ